LMSGERGILLITHYQRILNYVEPTFVHVFHDGKIVASGGPELSKKLEEQGYDWVTQELVPAGAKAPEVNVKTT